MDKEAANLLVKKFGQKYSDVLGIVKRKALKKLWESLKNFGEKTRLLEKLL